jgi:hypothetical protein
MMPLSLLPSWELWYDSENRQSIYAGRSGPARELAVLAVDRRVENLCKSPYETFCWGWGQQ